MEYLKTYCEYNGTQSGFDDQRIYAVPLLEVKDVENLFRRHDKDGYIIISGCIDVSRRHKNDIAGYASAIGKTLDELDIDENTDETDYYKRILLTLDRLEAEGFELDKISGLKKKAKHLLIVNNAENKRATRNMKERLKRDGYTFTVTAGGYVENGVNVLEHSFVVYVDKIDFVHRGKVDSKEHKYKCSFDELVDYGKKLCSKNEFDQECFSVKYPDNGKAVWMNEKGDVVMTFNKTLVNDEAQRYFTTTVSSKHKKDLGFFTPARPQRFSFVESFCKYGFPCCNEFRYIKEMDGIVCW